MKLKKLIKLFDPLNYIRIFSNTEDEEELIYEGTIFDIPWWIVELKIPQKLKNGEEPIHTWLTEKEGHKEGILIVSVDL